MASKVSTVTDAERARRAQMADLETPQSLAGVLYVAEMLAQGKTFDWTDPEGRTLPLKARHDILKEAILRLQVEELTREHLDPRQRE